MLDIVNYFSGAFINLFSFVSPEWYNLYELRICFVIIVSVMCAITLTITLQILKAVFAGFINLLRGL